MAKDTVALLSLRGGRGKGLPGKVLKINLNLGFRALLFSLYT